jgi:hypothetical protein
LGVLVARQRNFGSCVAEQLEDPEILLTCKNLRIQQISMYHNFVCFKEEILSKSKEETT